MKKFKNLFKKMSTQQNESVNDQVNDNEEQKEQVDVQPENEKENKVPDLQAKIDELNDKYLRLYSEFDNFRRRTAKEKVELIQTAGENVFKTLLPVVDDFERAIKSNAEITDVKTVTDGVNLIYNKLKNTLSQKGLEEMKSTGEAFNTDLHEAITNVPAPSDDLKGKVVEELEKGYTLNGKVIRFAKVVIGN
ncbi:MAG: nucleotide exchange factor GrpE [Bacteroidota bacterium]